MSGAAGPNFGLHYFWEDLEDGWGDKMNADLQKVNALIFGNVVDTATVNPPGNPLPGQMWLLLAANPTGAWAGHHNHIALWEKGVWNFYAPQEGWRVRSSADRAYRVFDGVIWNSFESTAAEVNEQLQETIDRVNDLTAAVGSTAAAAISAAAASAAAQAAAQTRQIVDDVSADVGLIRNEVYQLQQETDQARRDVIESSTEVASVLVNAEALARIYADDALDIRIDSLSATAGGLSAAINAEAIARANADSAAGIRIDTVTARARGSAMLNYNGNFENGFDGYGFSYTYEPHDNWVVLEDGNWGVWAQGSAITGSMHLILPGLAVVPTRQITQSGDIAMIGVGTAYWYWTTAYYTSAAKTTFLGYDDDPTHWPSGGDFSDDIQTKRETTKRTTTPPAGAFWAEPLIVFRDLQNSATVNGRCYVRVRQLKVELGALATPYPDQRSVRNSFAQLKSTQIAYAAADVALGLRIDTTNANLGTTNASVTSEALARVNADSALGAQIDSISASLGNTNANVTSEAIARANADVALGSRIDATNANLGTTNANVSSEVTARASADTALGVRIDSANASLGTTNANVTSEIAARASADTALGVRIDATNANLGTTNANVSSEATARANADVALGSRIDATNANLGTTNAAVSAEATARANGDAATGLQINNITARARGSAMLNYNGNFENGLDGYTFFYEDPQREVWGPIQDGYWGSWAQASMTYGQVNLEFPGFTVQPGRNITMSADVAFLNATATSYWYWTTAYYTNASQSNFLGYDDDPSRWYGGSDFTDDIQARRDATKRTSSPPANAYWARPILVYWRSANTNGARAYPRARQLKVELGNVPTPYPDNQSIRNNFAQLKSTQIAYAAADSALGSRIDSTNASLGTTNANLSSEVTARANADGALGIRIDTTNANLGTTNANVTSETIARANADGALSGRIDTTNANLGTTNANVTNESVARANGDSALSGQITSLSTTVGGISSSLTITQGAVGDLIGRNAAFLNIVAASGGNQAFVQVLADNYGSNIMFAAGSLGLMNYANGVLIPAMYATGGNVRFFGNVQIDGNLTIDGSLITTKIAANAITAIYEQTASGPTYGQDGGFIRNFIQNIHMDYDGTIVILTQINFRDGGGHNSNYHQSAMYLYCDGNLLDNNAQSGPLATNMFQLIATATLSAGDHTVELYNTCRSGDYYTSQNLAVIRTYNR